MRTSVLALLAVVVSACSGAIMGGMVEPMTSATGGGSSGTGTGGGSTPATGGGSSGPTWQVERFACDAQATPDELPLRRLTQRQYLNVVNDLIARSGLGATDRTAVTTALRDELAPFPADRLVGVPGEKHGGFTRLDQALQQGHVDTSYTVATEAGRELTSTTARRTALVGACATDTSTANDAQCLRDFITRFGRLVHRRPVTPEDVTFYTSVAGTTPVDAAVLADVIGLMLTSPQFLYHFEEGDPMAAGPSPLDAFALASRLSFHFWQTMPDDALLAAAQDGSLLTEAGYAAQVERLFADARTNQALDDFFSQWWRNDELPPLNTRIGTPIFDAFAGANVPSATLHDEMNAEVLELARHVARTNASVDELLTSRRFFARSPALAALYGQPAWDGTGTPPEFVQPERHGLLTRAAFLASGSANTRPVMKGFRVRNGLLCTSIPPPPPGAMATPIPLSPDLTTRETVEQITEQPMSSCRGCHIGLLNPLGFVTENFDALGRVRTSQRLFSDDGMVRLEKPISTRTAPNVAGFFEPVDHAGQVHELMRQGEFQTCFARQYFRFTFQRMEDDAKDGCLLRSLQDDALAGKPMAEVLKAVALAPSFKRRDVR
ncbi:MAG: DUF1592 domain-containing protein [Myxococcaceae bacterium]|jgi:hypothetical protein|nr:DUF1592 domain-containing protein [Myxococcaceae bacterium]